MSDGIVGLLWCISDETLPLTDVIDKALARFREKFNHDANTVYLSEDMAEKVSDELESPLRGLFARVSRTFPPQHFFVCREVRDDDD